MRTHTLLIALTLAAMWSGCKKSTKSDPVEPAKTRPAEMKSPVAKSMVNPKKVTPSKLPVKAPARDDTKWLISQSDKLNKCIHSLVVGLRSALDKPESLKSYAPASGKMSATCAQILLTTLKADLNVTAPLKHYYVLAAATLDTWNDILPLLTKEPPPKGAVLSKIDARISKAYNTFALQNNDLQGAPLLLPARPAPQGVLDLRTYGDELARLGETVWGNLNTWHMNHDLPPKAPPPFRKNVLRERVALRLMESIVKRHGIAFMKLKCVAGFTRPKGKPTAKPSAKPLATKGVPAKAPKKKSQEVTCALLKQQGGALTSAWKGYVSFWNGLLSNPPATLPATTGKKAIELHRALKGAVQVLPPRIR